MNIRDSAAGAADICCGSDDALRVLNTLLRGMEKA